MAYNERYFVVLTKYFDMQTARASEIQRRLYVRRKLPSYLICARRQHNSLADTEIKDAADKSTCLPNGSPIISEGDDTTMGNRPNPVFVYVRQDENRPDIRYLSVTSMSPDRALVAGGAVITEVDECFTCLLRAREAVVDDLARINHVKGAAINLPVIVIIVNDPANWTNVQVVAIDCLLIHCHVSRRRVTVVDSQHAAAS